MENFYFSCRSDESTSIEKQNKGGSKELNLDEKNLPITPSSNIINTTTLQNKLNLNEKNNSVQTITPSSIIINNNDKTNLLTYNNTTIIIISNDKNNHNNNNNNINEKKEEDKNKPVEIIDPYGIVKQDKDDKSLYIICFHCKEKIKTKLYDIKENFLLNFQNFKCDKCNQFNFITVCPQCKYIQQMNEFKSEGESFTCSNPECNYSYLQTLCPIKNCQEMFYFPVKKNFANSPNGLIHTHMADKIKKNELIIFQKISCFFCCRPIVFYSTELNRNAYYETMPIKCFYPDCQKSFHRIICSNNKCYNIIYKEFGTYKIGQKITCEKCEKNFSKILCVNCFRVIPLEKNIFKYGELECRYKSCSKKNNYAICFYCNQLNYFKGLPYPLVQGWPIQCGNKDCQKFFNIIYCPGCHELNPFSNGDFVFGRPYKCKYTSICSKMFLVLVCSNCWNYSRMIDDIEGKKYTCNQCGTLLANFQCVHCGLCILDKNSFFNFGQPIKCPSCSKLFSFFRCYDCKRLIYYKGKILGKRVQCQNCFKYSVNTICPKCQSKITFSRRDSDITSGEEINCPSCQIKFIFGDKLGDEFEKIYEKDLTCVKPLIGSVVNQAIPTVDENYLERRKNFYDENMKREIQKNNELCIICQTNNKESVFFPCGHRCTCYKCAVVYFEVKKKCPKCNKNSKTIIPKIFDT
jgi:hypothetical protein